MCTVVSVTSVMHTPPLVGDFQSEAHSVSFCGLDTDGKLSHLEALCVHQANPKNSDGGCQRATYTRVVR